LGNRRRFAEQKNDLGRTVRLKLQSGLQGAAGIEAGANAIGKSRRAGQSSRPIEPAVAAEELRSIPGPRLLPAGEVGERHAVPELATPGIPRQHRPGCGIDLGDDERRDGATGRAEHPLDIGRNGNTSRPSEKIHDLEAGYLDRIVDRHVLQEFKGNTVRDVLEPAVPLAVTGDEGRSFLANGKRRRARLARYFL